MTAEDGETTKTYTVTVTRAGAGDATLSGVTLTSAFVSGTMVYTGSVGHGVSVNATVSDANASVEITPEDADDETPGDQVNLAVGETWPWGRG